MILRTTSRAPRMLAAIGVAFAFAAMTAQAIADPNPDADRPNILWITCEDISPNVGCYGDDYAVTPNIDRLAREGIRYSNAFATIGVCAPARSTIITGMYPPSIGTQHMRCRGELPEGVRCFPEYLRGAGYHCTNNAKTDYNFIHPESTWDESSRDASYRNREDGQPFFAVINFTSCHESQIRLPEEQYQARIAEFEPHEIHNPDQAPVPPYHPNTPTVRNDWARYADMITFMDKQVGEVLQQLEDDGLAQDTIVFFYSDHGAGMPRDKRWLYDSSTRVPFIVRFPEKYAHLAPAAPGESTDRLISFVDLAPTALSLAGISIPEHMQGFAFLGEQEAGPRDYVQGFRDRMDERYDLIRMVRDEKYKYIRNFLPQMPYFHHQRIGYMYEMPTMAEWQELADFGILTGPPANFMAMTKPVEELYDVERDPFEVNNLALDPEYRDTLDRLRAELRRWQLEILDLGLLHEADMRSRFAPISPYDGARRDPASYPIDRILAAADLAGRGASSDVAALAGLLDDDDPGVRWWAATGLAIRGESSIGVGYRLREALNDPSPWVGVAAVDALVRQGRIDDALPALLSAIGYPNDWVRLAAINVLDRLDDRARPDKEVLREVLREALDDSNEYVTRVAEQIAAKFDDED